MDWDPEVDDATRVRRRLAEAGITGDRLEDERQAATDQGLVGETDSVQHPGLDPLSPIDPDSPVSGHHPPREGGPSIVDTPEQDWTLASGLIYPSLRPIGTHGFEIDRFSTEALAAEGQKSHSQPLLDEGPCELPVVYTLTASGFDVLVNADHLLTWGVGTTDIQDAALANLGTWSATAPWTTEESGGRRLLSSVTGDGWDASRILLPAAREHLGRELGTDGARVLVGIPERDLLVAGSLRPDDDEFGGLFADFVVEQSGGADEPIDRRVLELVDGQLVEYAG
jgi:hypothetical protein